MTTPAAPELGKQTAMVRLSIMMFLQYAVWGIWLVNLVLYLRAPVEPGIDEAGNAVTGGGLGFTPGQIGWIYGLAGSIGAVTAPFLAGQVADRFMNAEKYLGNLLIVGGIVKFVTFYAHDFTPFLLLSILYSIVYMPTLGLSNSIAFAHIRDPERDFPFIRVWGTVGWIVGVTAFSLFWLQTELEPSAMFPFLAGEERELVVDGKDYSKRIVGSCLQVSGVLSMIYGLWAMFGLPATPPKKDVEHPLAFARAFSLLRDPAVFVVTAAALPIAMIHQVYFFHIPTFLEHVGFRTSHVGPVTTIGQAAEIGLMALLGVLLKRLGYKWTLALGCLAFFLRFMIFASVNPGDQGEAIVAASMVLHGLCYGFFFATAFIFIERVAPPDVRHSAQTAFGMVILGIGPISASVYNLGLERLAANDDGDIVGWTTQAAVGLACFLLIGLAFRPAIRRAGETEDDRELIDTALESPMDEVGP